MLVFPLVFQINVGDVGRISGTMFSSQEPIQQNQLDLTTSLLLVINNLLIHSDSPIKETVLVTFVPDPNLGDRSQIEYLPRLRQNE
jgi:hypothetical protein